MQTSRHAINVSSKRSLSHIILNRGWSPVSHSRSKLSLFSTFKNGLTWYFSKIYWGNDNCLFISLLGAAAPVAGQAAGSMTHGRTASHHNHHKQLKVRKTGSWTLSFTLYFILRHFLPPVGWEFPCSLCTGGSKHGNKESENKTPHAELLLKIHHMPSDNICIKAPNLQPDHLEHWNICPQHQRHFSL